MPTPPSSLASCPLDAQARPCLAPAPRQARLPHAARWARCSCAPAPSPGSRGEARSERGRGRAAVCRGGRGEASRCSAGGVLGTRVGGGLGERGRRAQRQARGRREWTSGGGAAARPGSGRRVPGRPRRGQPGRGQDAAGTARHPRRGQASRLGAERAGRRRVDTSLSISVRYSHSVIPFKIACK